MTIRTILVLLPLALLASCAGFMEAAPAVAAGAVATLTFSQQIMDLLSPYLPPDVQVQLAQTLGTADNIASATARAVGAMGQWMRDLQAAQDATWTGGEVLGAVGGVGGAAAAAGKAWATHSVRKERGEPTQVVGLPASKVHPLGASQ